MPSNPAVKPATAEPQLRPSPARRHDIRSSSAGQSPKSLASERSPQRPWHGGERCRTRQGSMWGLGPPAEGGNLAERDSWGVCAAGKARALPFKPRLARGCWRYKQDRYLSLQSWWKWDCDSMSDKWVHFGCHRAPCLAPKAAWMATGLASGPWHSCPLKAPLLRSL